ILAQDRENPGDPRRRPTMPTELDTKPWERRPGESARAFEAAGLYFELGPARSIDAVARALGGQQGSRKRAAGHINRWASEFEGAARARAFDADQDAIRREAADRATAAEAATWARRRQALREHAWMDAQALRAKAAEMLQVPALQKVEEVVEDGTPVAIYRPA